MTNQNQEESFLNHPLVSQACLYASKVHADANHLYDKTKPYTTHLSMVANFAVRFSDLLPESERPFAVAGAWVHDCIEDARQSYNDVKKATCYEVAEIAFALTNEKGRTRKTRANDKYYEGIRENPTFVFVKICDRLANAYFSSTSGSRMLAMYAEEQAHFRAALDPENSGQFAPMWDELEKILGLRDR